MVEKEKNDWVLLEAPSARRPRLHTPHPTPSGRLHSPPHRDRPRRLPPCQALCDKHRPKDVTQRKKRRRRESKW
mgnify:CR=1 FL=1